MSDKKTDDKELSMDELKNVNGGTWDLPDTNGGVYNNLKGKKKSKGTSLHFEDNTLETYDETNPSNDWKTDKTTNVIFPGNGEGGGF
jgi:bacteriocin-like protein